MDEKASSPLPKKQRILADETKKGRASAVRTVEKMLSDGQDIPNIASQLGLTEKSVSRVKWQMLKNSSRIINSPVQDVDKALHSWCIEQYSRGVHVMPLDIVLKAAKIHEQLGIPFRGSIAWARAWKIRNKVADIDSVFQFKSSFKRLVEQENYSLEYVYNADEMYLEWKGQNNNTDENDAKPEHDHFVTVFMCANGTGTHKVPLHIVGKRSHLRAFEFPGVVYSNHNRAFFENGLFRRWYSNTFIPSVLNHQQAMGEKQKVLLIVDNALQHTVQCTIEHLNRINPSFEIVTIPELLSVCLQPMEQLVPKVFKEMYYKKFSDFVALNGGGKEDISKKLTLKVCFPLITQVWKAMPQTTINRSWLQLWPNVDDIQLIDIKNEETVLDDEDPLQEVPHETIFVSNPGLLLPGLIKDTCNSDAVNVYNTYSENTSSTVLEVPPLVPIHKKSNIHQNSFSSLAWKSAEGNPTDTEALSAFNIALKWLQNTYPHKCREIADLRKLQNLAADTLNGRQCQES